MKRALILVALLCALLNVSVTAKEYSVYFGTYTGQKSKGIYVSSFDSTTGKLGTPQLAAETKSPSFLALHPNGKFVYAVGESAVVGEKKQGGVTAFAIEPAGTLKQLNTQPSGGTGPCHLAVDERGKIVVVANYGSGSVGVLSVQNDGSLGDPLKSFQHVGSSVNAQRQTGPHAHCANITPDGKFALVCDLGTDKVMVYRLGGKEGLTENDPPFTLVGPGLGPRHIAFSSNGEYVYVVNEMGSSVTVFDYDAKQGTLKETQTTSTLPDKFDGKSTCAEIAVHPSGKFVYASNRGHDSIAVFKVDGKTGQLSSVEHTLTQGKTPRHFAIDPSGGWLLAENQGSDSVVVFQINKSTGRLKPTGQTVEVGSPVCAVFLPKTR